MLSNILPGVFVKQDFNRAAVDRPRNVVELETPQTTVSQRTNAGRGDEVERVLTIPAWIPRAVFRPQHTEDAVRDRVFRQLQT
jgi:hypothetical protein